MSERASNASPVLRIHLSPSAVGTDFTASGNGTDRDTDAAAATVSHPMASNGHHTNGTTTASNGKQGRSPRLKRQHSSMDEESLRLQVTYNRLSWTVQVPNTDEATKKSRPTVAKKVLDDVRGTFRPGRFTAIMGASGAGKTTLLNVIAGYGKGGETTGDIVVNGSKISSVLMRELTAFVHQHDVILPSMTVREAVTMAAHLRLPRTMSDVEKNARVEEVLRWLSLVKVANNQIGSPEKKGISGGERRRVSIAMELVRNPPAIFLDEPTSGLDSYTAYAVAFLLRRVAHMHQRTIVATIHQPSSEIFDLFDDLVLLSAGRVIYHGPANHAMTYFSTHLGYAMPKYTNPADYIFRDILNSSEKRSMGVDGSKPITDGQTKTGNGLRNRAQRNQPSDPSAAKDKSTRSAEMNAKKPAMIELTAMPLDRAAGASASTTTSLEKLSGSTDAAAAGDTDSLHPLSPLSEDEREHAIISKWNEPSTSSGEFTPEREQLDREVSAQMSENAAEGRPLPDERSLEKNVAPFSLQFYFLCLRAFRDALRNPFKLHARTGQALFVSIFCGLVYLQLGLDNNGIVDRKGALFFLCAGGIMNSCMGTIPLFIAEREVFWREYPSRMYSLAAFFWSKFLMELPLRIFYPILMAVITYFMIDLQPGADKFWIFALTLILLDICGTSLGLVFATVFPSLPVALAASPMVLLPLMLFSGYFLNSNTIPPYFDWLQYLSPIKYGFRALCRNEFPGLEFTTDMGTVTGQDVLEQLNFVEESSLGGDLGCIVALAVGFIALAYFALWRSARKL